MADDDLVYLLRRSVEERTRARDATDDSAKAAHRGMADAYREKLSACVHPAPGPRQKLRFDTG